MKIKPLGNRILIAPLKNENYVTDKNIEIVNLDLNRGEIIEFSQKFKDVYKTGDIVLYPKGCGIAQTYNGKTHIWVNGLGATDGDVWAIIGNVNDK